MNAKEVRIGNLVKIGGEVSELELCDFVDIYENNTLKIYEPIPLTEEWLLKFGFEKTLDEVFFYDSEYQIFVKCVIDSIFDVAPFVETFIFNQMTTIQYVHELQNLYFALTGEEFTI